ncbi:MAG TPA: thiamine phosphate synthase, partial [Pirellulales bacterium]|nr:thiamine phosphate synthase [Pirellulales bacterium]
MAGRRSVEQHAEIQRSYYPFTAAAERALAAAAGWANGAESEFISPPKLLLGLLAEAESRAAEMLAACGIDAAAVLARWPALTPRTTADRKAALSFELEAALAAAASHLAEFPRPLEFATEHLLLGLVAAENESADWLAERGFTAAGLTADICRLYGYQSVVRGPWSVVGCDEVAPAAGDESTPDDRPLATDHGPRTTDYKPRTTDHGLLRLIDAAANRAREGLRVVEDFVRFIWDDRHLMRECKQLRHDLAAALATLAWPELLASRDTTGDVGTAVSTAAEQVRPDMASVVTANFKRLQESLRSIEEFGKVLDPAMAQSIEQLRYRSYTLERAVATTSLGFDRLAEARLYVLIDGRRDLAAYTELARELVAAGVDVLQLRDKRLADAELLARARRLRELTLNTATLFVMNDRPDLAVLADADGVHVGQDELSVRECRAIVGPRMLVGVSTHSLEQACRAVLDGANYIGVGPTFASRTKHFSDADLRGLDLLRAVQAEIRL